MQTKIIQVIFLFLTLSLLSATKPEKKNRLIGTWNRVNTETKGNPAMANVKRTMTFDDKNQFDGKIFIPGKGTMQYNSGIYLLADDTTMVMINKDSKGKMVKSANYYNFQIQNDSLHLLGNYLQRQPNDPQIVKVISFEEWWVKSSSKD